MYEERILLTNIYLTKLSNNRDLKNAFQFGFESSNQMNQFSSGIDQSTYANLLHASELIRAKCTEFVLTIYHAKYILPMKRDVRRRIKLRSNRARYKKCKGIESHPRKLSKILGMCKLFKYLDNVRFLEFINRCFPIMISLQKKN